uniref:Protein kinase domain-containing protein n=1 Tax=viral metagenome TaxID=1070528 RepID=A0A6C0H3B4_9ZZZZ
MVKQDLDLIHINVLNEWISVDPKTIRIEGFKLQSVPANSFATYLIEYENGNKGIALLSDKILDKIENEKLWSGNYGNVVTLKTCDDSSKFSPISEQFSKGIRNIPVQRSIFLKTICFDSGVCLAFGNQTKLIRKHFNNFVDFKYVISPVKTIGIVSNNGFVKEITYEREGYRANAILKSTNKEDSDNLLFEYLVGQYINKQCLVFPCFIETYGWYVYNTSDDWAFMKGNKEVSDQRLKYSLEFGKSALQTYIDSKVQEGGNICFEDKRYLIADQRECTETESLLKLACAKSNYLCILTQHIKNAKSLNSMIASSIDVDFPYYDLINVLYQIYMPLATLSETFTHYDFHLGNTLIYQPVIGKYIEYKYKLNDGTSVKFKCRYMVKIIDYGRSFFYDETIEGISGSSKAIYESICKNIKECNAGGRYGYPVTYCGEDQGFSNFDTSKYGIGYSINSGVRNITHDLLLLYRAKKLLKHPSLSHKIQNPLLQAIFDKSEYGNEILLEAEELATGEEKYEFGSVEKYDQNPLIDGMPERIDNVIDVHNALKTQILKNQQENDDYHESMASLGRLKIYESGKPMKFKPR